MLSCFRGLQEALALVSLPAPVWGKPTWQPWPIVICPSDPGLPCLLVLPYPPYVAGSVVITWARLPPPSTCLEGAPTPALAPWWPPGPPRGMGYSGAGNPRGRQTQISPWRGPEASPPPARLQTEEAQLQTKLQQGTLKKDFSGLMQDIQPKSSICVNKEASRYCITGLPY